MISEERFAYNFNDVHIQIQFEGLNEKEKKAALRIVDTSARILKSRRVEKKWLNLIKFVAFQSDPLLEYGGVYCDGNSRDNCGFKVNLEGGASIERKVETFIHEFGHLIHYNASRELQMFWAKIAYRLAELSPVFRELLQKHPRELWDNPEGLHSEEVSKHLQEEDWPSEYSRTNLLETFSEVFKYFILYPEKLSYNLREAMRQFLSEEGVKPITEGGKKKKHNVNQAILHISRQHDNKRI
jgi:hypothetical protein